MKDFLTVTLIIFLLFIAACGPSAEEKKNLKYKENITTLIKADKNIATYTYHEPTQQAAEMRKLDLSQCPPSFSAAYVDHLHAWEKLSRIDRALNILNSIGTESSAQLLLNDLLGTNDSQHLNAGELDKKLRYQRLVVVEDIQTTWNEVERIAVTYGATLTQ